MAPVHHRVCVLVTAFGIVLERLCQAGCWLWDTVTLLLRLLFLAVLLFLYLGLCAKFVSGLAASRQMRWKRR